MPLSRKFSDDVCCVRFLSVSPELRLQTCDQLSVENEGTQSYKEKKYDISVFYADYNIMFYQLLCAVSWIDFKSIGSRKH